VRTLLSTVGVAVIVVVTACGGEPSPARTPAGGRASCAKDSDCVVTDRSGCCDACPRAPFAIPSLVSEQRKNQCSVVECAAPPAGVVCAKVDSPVGYVARCREGTCAAEKPR
jgi:hypothetical protein